MDISLKGQIVILDEGHNIEDACRESASFSCREDLIQESMDDLRKIGLQLLPYLWAVSFVIYLLIIIYCLIPVDHLSAVPVSYMKCWLYIHNNAWIQNR